MSLITEALEKSGNIVEQKPVAKPRLHPSLKEESLQVKAAPPAEPIRPVSSFLAKAKLPVQAKKSVWILFAAAILLALWGGAVTYFMKQGVVTKQVETSVSRDSSILQNPFSNAGPKFSLTGITLSGSQRYALINNQVVGVGDFLKKENATVVQIQDKSVILTSQGREIRLSL